MTPKGLSVRVSKRILGFAASFALVFGPIAGCSSDESDPDSTGSGGSSAATSGGSGGSGALSTGGAGAATGGSPSTGGVGTGGAGTGGIGTGGAGAGGFRSGGTGGVASDAPGGCFPIDVACDAPGATCCAGLECVDADPSPFCLVRCEMDSECETGCCVKYGNVDEKVCGTAEECANCAGAGETCGDLTPCCGGSICTTIETGFHCAPECTEHSDCATNCCVPFSNVFASVCLDPKYCPT